MASRSSKCRKTTPPDHAASPKIPHSSERDGVLCLVPDHATFSVDNPYAGVSVLLAKAVNLIEGFVRGNHEDDFKTEFLTYWDHAKKGTERTILSLVRPEPPSRM